MDGGRLRHPSGCRAAPSFSSGAGTALRRGPSPFSAALPNVRGMNEPSPPGRRPPHLFLLSLALLVAGVNALKPITIDDAAYVAYARQVSAHPLDPYGFAVFWWSWPEPANEVLAPPGLAYGVAPLIRLAPDQPAVWKFGLLPLVVLLAYALDALARRFAPGWERPLVLMTLLSPAFLPSLNLMLDVPTQALALGGVALFARAVDRQSFALAVVAGLLAGLALETKYTGGLAPAAMLLYALCFGGFRLGVVAAMTAAQLFVSWEYLMALLYGESHFFLHARAEAGGSLFKWHNLRYLLPILGSVGAPGALLGLAALGVRWRAFLGALAVGVLPFAIVACLGGELTVNVKLFGALSAAAESTLPFEHFLFGCVGVGVIVTSLGVMACLVRPRGGWAAWPWGFRRAGLFLVLWLFLELLGYVVLTPFPAVRRVLGLVAVGTLAAGWLAARGCRRPAARRLAYAAVATSALLGLLVNGIDLIDSHAQKEGIERTARRLRDEGTGNATVWYVGHWGLQYYAEREGMRPVVPYDPPANAAIPLGERTRFRPGDYLVIPDYRITRQPYTRDEARTEHVFAIWVTDPIPWQTIPCYYGGRCAVENHDCARLVIDVYRVTAAHTASR